METLLTDKTHAVEWSFGKFPTPLLKFPRGLWMPVNALAVRGENDAPSNEGGTGPILDGKRTRHIFK